MEKLVKRDGKGRQQCTRCNFKSVAGLTSGKGLCPYHFDAQMFGDAWADSLYLSEKEKPEC